MAINTMAKLRAVYRPPAARAGLKILDHLDVHCRNFIALSPFYVISSARADGRADASSRGDPPEGVPQDDAEAVRWYRLAADQGRASAQNNLGGMYSNGRGVPQDAAEAARWYRLAADQGDAAAQFNLGLMYAKGRGVPQDYVSAHMWANLAAAQGHENARELRDTLAEAISAAERPAIVPRLIGRLTHTRLFGRRTSARPFA